MQLEEPGDVELSDIIEGSGYDKKDGAFPEEMIPTTISSQD